MLDADRPRPPVAKGTRRGAPARVALAAVAAGLLCVAGAQAQQPASYPSRALRWIVAVPPGSTNDLISRLVAQRLSDALAQPVLVDNRPGGAFVIATEIIARAAPDGHTVGTLLTPHVVNPYVMKNLPYDTLRDFTPISNMVIVPGLLVVHPSVPATSLKELIAYARSRPGALNYGAPGPLTSGHLSIEMLKVMTGIDVAYIPYKGGAPAIADLAGGNIQMLVAGPPGLMPHVKAGRMRAIATTAARRSPGTPDIPTFAESGLPGYDTYEWYGLFAPAGIPAAALERLGREIPRIVRDPELSERLTAQGAIPVGDSPAEFAAFIRREMQVWGKVARQVGLRPS
jgi:tripartite-type tricarboxylate transporter receptor subunit TctC